jgi:hypothetical protein
MRNQIKRCILCRSEAVTTQVEQERIVTAACHSCGATFRVEFDPPDEPHLRGRIDVLSDPHDTDRDTKVH